MRRTSGLALLLLAAILIASCGEEADRITSVSTPPDSPPLRSLAFLDSLDYVTLSGTLSGGQSGAFLQSLPPDWPKNCKFGFIVPETSMPLSSIEFTIEVPTKEMYTSSQWASVLEHRLFMRLGPDGTQFTGPITVIGTWMPWENSVLAANPQPEIYAISGPDTVQATVLYFATDNRYRVQFDVDHFSDWEACPEPEPGG